MTKLSPASLAVLTAFRERYAETLHYPGPFSDSWQVVCLAAALETLATRVRGSESIRQDLINMAEELKKQ